MELCEEIINKPLSEIGTQTELTTTDINNLVKMTNYYQNLAKQETKNKEVLTTKLKFAERKIELAEKFLQTNQELADKYDALLINQQ